MVPRLELRYLPKHHKLHRLVSKGTVPKPLVTTTVALGFIVIVLASINLSSSHAYSVSKRQLRITNRPATVRSRHSGRRTIDSRVTQAIPAVKVSLVCNRTWHH